MIQCVDRVAKRVLVRLDSADTLVFEPRMTGLVLVSDPPNQIHLRFGLFLENDVTPELWFWDRRGLGSVKLFSEDEFVVEIRDGESENAVWTSAKEIQETDAGVGSRAVHAAAFKGLNWNHVYEYRVTHLSAGAVLGEYQSEFRTRLRPGDAEPFSFAAYGDSAVNDDRISGFRNVQKRIAEHEVDFAVLLGDNIYETGSHNDADARFDPDRNPEATDWIASHVDYFVNVVA